MKVMMTGGGTLGPVTPLLAVVEAWRRIDAQAEFVWVGTPSGPERTVVEAAGLPFFALSSPKLDRYAPLKWLFVPVQLAIAMYGAIKLVRRERPEVVVTAGGYVSVPVVWTAKLLGIPSWVHQQDVRPGLANKLMAGAATKVSVAWTKTLSAFPEGKTLLIGNPARSSVQGGDQHSAAERFQLDPARPTVLVLGGGTGSTWINQAIAGIAPELTKSANILHITGKGKSISSPLQGEGGRGHYIQTELVTSGMADVFALADVVVCRAGMGTISELASLKKAAIVVAIPESHQEDNTAALADVNAAVILSQTATTPQMLLQAIRNLLSVPETRTKLGARLHAALPTDGVAEKLVIGIRSIAKNSTN